MPCLYTRRIPLQYIQHVLAMVNDLGPTDNEAGQVLTAKMSSVKSPRCSLLQLPARVCGMQVWDIEAFNMTLQVPYITLAPNMVNAAVKVLKHVVLRIPNLPSVCPAPQPPHKEVLLHPDLIRSLEDFELKHREMLRTNCDVTEVKQRDIQLTLKNWRAADVLKAVTEDLDRAIPALSAFSIIDHIIHVNLKVHHKPQKAVIGQILLHGNQPRIRTVINKSSGIDSKFRNFQYEILAGEDDFLVKVKESGCQFEMDFAKVYWNPRLSTEHERIVALIAQGDYLLDACAGVGPFAIPAARKRAHVLANDLNPESFRWLESNVSLNKVQHHIQCFNLDARAFLKAHLPQVLGQAHASGVKVHVTMNLPAMAIEFLDVFPQIFQTVNEGQVQVHVHAFSEAEDQEADVKSRAWAHLGLADLADHDKPVIRTHHVRNVAPKKDMFRASVTLEPQTFSASPCKKLKTS